MKGITRCKVLSLIFNVLFSSFLFLQLVRTYKVKICGDLEREVRCLFLILNVINTVVIDAVFILYLTVIGFSILGGLFLDDDDNNNNNNNNNNNYKIIIAALTK